MSLSRNWLTKFCRQVVSSLYNRFACQVLWLLSESDAVQCTVTCISGTIQLFACLQADSRTVLQIASWNAFDVFQVANLSKAKPLETVTLALFAQHDLLDKLKIPYDRLQNFVRVCTLTHTHRIHGRLHCHLFVHTSPSSQSTVAQCDVSSHTDQSSSNALSSSAGQIIYAM